MPMHLSWTLTKRTTGKNPHICSWKRPLWLFCQELGSGTGATNERSRDTVYISYAGATCARSQIMAGCMLNPGRMHAETSCYKCSQLLNVESIVASWRHCLSYALWDKVLQLLCRVSGSWRYCWSYARWDKVLLALESSFNLCVTCSPLNLDDFYASQHKWASYSI